MYIAVVGLSHKTASVEIREKLSVPEPQLKDAITQLTSYSQIREIAILSTCNRLEIYIVTETSATQALLEKSTIMPASDRF